MCGCIFSVCAGVPGSCVLQCSSHQDTQPLDTTQEECPTVSPVGRVGVLLHGQSKVLLSLTGLRGAAERRGTLKAIAESCQCNSVGPRQCRDP